MALVPRNKIWDLEYDIYCHLQDKNKALATATDEKFKYFSTLLEEFHVPDTNTGKEHAQFLDGLYSTVSTQINHLPEPEPEPIIDDTAEEVEEEDDELDKDPQYKIFLDHLRPDGKFYALEIHEDKVFVSYHHESESSTHEALAICAAHENENHVSYEMHAECKRKRRGKKPKRVSRKCSVRNSDGSGGNNVTSSEPQKNNENDGNNNNSKKRKMGRPRKKDVPNTVKIACIDKTQNQITIYHKTKDGDGIEAEVKEEIKDYDVDVDVDVDEVQVLMQQPVKNVENFWNDDKGNARKVSEYREKLMQELERPYCEEEYERLFKDISLRKPVQHHKELRKLSVTFEEDYLGKSFLDHNIDLSRKIYEFRDDHPRVLNLMRGFFYWLKNCSNEDAFMPWRHCYCLDVLPQPVGRK